MQLQSYFNIELLLHKNKQCMYLTTFSTDYFSIDLSGVTETLSSLMKQPFL